MTTPTLSDLLQRLRSEPEWKSIHADVVTRKKCDSLIMGEIIEHHNATRARLLAVVEALEMACGQLIYLRPVEDMTTRAEEDITAKLAAALKPK